MILTKININIIETEIIKDSNDIELINILKQYENATLIDLILYDKHIINRLPSSILKNNISYLKEHFFDILSYCDICDIDIITQLMSCCLDKDNKLFLASKLINNTSLKPELLHLYMPDVFTDYILLNHSSVKLNKSYVCKMKNLASNIDMEFFKLNTITKNIIKRILKDKNKLAVDVFFKKLSISLQNGIATVEEDAMIYCINKYCIKEILKRHSFTNLQQIKIFNLIEKDEESLIEFIKTQNLSNYFIKKFIKQNMIHYYLAHNNFCTNDILINFHKNYSSLNWLYVNTNLNISNYIEYANYLHEIGSTSIVAYNMQLNVEKGLKINNIRSLAKFNIDENFLFGICYYQIKELDIGIHLSQ